MQNSMHNPQPLASGQALSLTGPEKGDGKERRAGLTASAAPFTPSASSTLTPTAKPFTPSAQSFIPSSSPRSLSPPFTHPIGQGTGLVKYFPPPPYSSMPPPPMMMMMMMQTSRYSPPPYLVMQPTPTFAPTYKPTYTPTFTPPPPTTPAEPMCQVIAHYHTCGCLAKPTFLCGRRSCLHERPTQISVGKLPFPCTAKWTGNTAPEAKGRGPACEAPDPGSKGWIRDMGMSQSFGKLLVLTGDVITLDDLVSTLPDDVEFDDWAEEMKAKCDERKVESVVKEDDEEGEDEGGKVEEEKEEKSEPIEIKVAMVDCAMQTDDLPEEEEEEEEEEKPSVPQMDIQTEEPPQAELKRTATQLTMSSMVTQSTVAHEPAEDPEESVEMKNQSTQWIEPEEEKKKPEMQSQGTQSTTTTTSMATQSTTEAEADEIFEEIDLDTNVQGTQPWPESRELAIQTEESEDVFVVGDDDADDDADKDADTMSAVSDDYLSAVDYKDLDPYEDYDDDYDSEEDDPVIDLLLDIDNQMVYSSDEDEDEDDEANKAESKPRSLGIFQRFSIRKA